MKTTKQTAGGISLATILTLLGLALPGSAVAQGWGDDGYEERPYGGTTWADGDYDDWDWNSDYDYDEDEWDYGYADDFDYGTRSSTYGTTGNYYDEWDDEVGYDYDDDTYNLDGTSYTDDWWDDDNEFDSWYDE